MNDRKLTRKKVALIGVPSSAGARMAGQELAPQSLRSAGLVEGLRAAGCEVLDLGDLGRVSYAPDRQQPKQQNLARVLAVLRQVADKVESAVAEQAWPLVIGGDCTVTIGVLAGLMRRLDNIGLMYVDGDVDLNTPDTTFTGILDGMVVAHILGHGARDLCQVGPRCPLLAASNISLFGYSVQAGGLDPVEVEILKDTRMATHPLDAIGPDVPTAASRALRELESKSEHILVHFDTDVIDADDFPAVDVPHKPGLGFTQAQQALKAFLEGAKSTGLVLTEFNAGLDADGALASKLAVSITDAMKSAA